MFSLNVPVPAAVARLASEVAADWPSATPRTREEHTLVLKRLGSADRTEFSRLRARTRAALAGAAPFAVRVARIDQFRTVPAGEAPVVYLAVDGDELRGLHERLVTEFGAVAGLEGPDYVPHVTIARGGDPSVADRLVEREVDPIEWHVEELRYHDARRGVTAGRLSLPV